MGENAPSRSSDPINMDGSSGSRVRTQSECSAASEDGTSGIGSGKRQRTTSQTFMVTSALTAASPPKFVSLEEIMQAANGMKDMALVHEIVVDNEFRLERYEPPENTLHRAVKDNMHRAFWEMLRKDFSKDPPNYTHALVLLEDVKTGLFDLLLPQHTKLRQQISEILDSELIKQQVEQGVFDFKHYSQYVISVMGNMCAPARDDRIKELTEMTDVVDTFRGILEMLDVMALDMANTMIQFTKPEIIAQSIQLERKKFADYLAIQTDGLEFTRKWILRNLTVKTNENQDRVTFVRNHIRETLQKAMLELLEWDQNEPYPETFMLDETRMRTLQTETEKIILVGTIILIVFVNVGSDLDSNAAFKAQVKEHLLIIMQSYKSPSDVSDLLANISIQVIKDIKEYQQKHSLTPITEEKEKIITNLVLDVGTDDHKIKGMVRKRVLEFIGEIIISCTAAPQQVPTGLTQLQKELTAIVGQYLRIISHNTTVFCIYYNDIIEKALPAPTTTATTTSAPA